jgi:hypothetical protein
VVYERAVKAGADIVYPLTDEDWGLRRLFVRDPTVQSSTSPSANNIRTTTTGLLGLLPRTAHCRGYGGPVLDLSRLDLAEIVTALADQTGYEYQCLINPATGEVVLWTSDTGIDGHTPVDLDELDLISIGPLSSCIWCRDMADVADRISDHVAGRRLARAIQGRGAFRCFKAELHEEHPQLLPVSCAFRDARAQRRGVEWLADNSIIDHGAATLPRRAPRAEPTVSRTAGHSDDSLPGAYSSSPTAHYAPLPRAAATSIGVV